MDGDELCFTQLNASCSRTRPRSRLSAVLLALVAVLTVVLNLLVVVSISHFRQLHTTTNLLVFSLAVTDFLLGFLQMPSVLVLYQSCWLLGNFICDVNFFMGGFLVSVSVGNMVLISVDRYVAVCEPMFYSTKVTVKRVQLCVCLCWLCSVVHSSWLLRDFFKQQHRYDFCSGACAAEFKLSEVAFDTAVTFLGPVAVIVLLYVRIFAVAVSQARAMRSHVTAFAAKRSEAVRPKKSELKAARTLGVVIVVFILCYSPFCVIIVGIMNNSTWAFDATIQYWLVYSNSCLNPLIYAFVYPWFRKSIKHIVTLQILQPNSSEANVL
ncbi:trace amine-associated receptor 13c-like [Betta splendens]|uniref:Trace amine-associated receptor 13c-like n=1 Tax=Betta splendens TaxID=158456 RepID=A0A6P7LD80_BETSP|nr:trace amine-associated receptor 13c-like [Betta splendens]